MDKGQAGHEDETAWLAVRRSGRSLTRAVLCCIWALFLVLSAPRVRALPCAGDCGGNGQVTIDEIVKSVSIAFGAKHVSECAAGDANDDKQVTIDEIVGAVNGARMGCRTEPTPTPSATQLPTITPVPTPTVEGARCGDGAVNQPSEACDPPDELACPGRCSQNCSCCPAPTILTIAPLTGPVGTAITITGTNLDCGGASQVSLSCGGVAMAALSLSPTAIQSVIPPGASDCRVLLVTSGGSSTAPEQSRFDVKLSEDFALSVIPPEGKVIRGGSTKYTLMASGSDGFTGLVALSVSGLPDGVSASFSGPTITNGQSVELTVTAAVGAGLRMGSPFSIRGVAEIDGVIVSQSADARVTVVERGETGVTGQFVFLHGSPLKGVELTVHTPGCDDAVPTNCPTTRTDAGGNFQFVGLPTGKHKMTVDCTPVDQRLPIYGVDIVPVEGEVVQLDQFKICPPLPAERYTPINQAASQEQVITDISAPGAEFKIPSGVTIIGWDGVPKTQMTVQKLSLDELPVPPPPGPTRSLYQPMWGTPMGGVPSAPIPVTLPNDLGLAPGAKANLYYYDSAPLRGAGGDWRLAGAGTVTKDGLQITTDPGVGVERFCGVCGLSCFVAQQQDQGNRDPDGAQDGDPVDLGLGQMIVDKTDLMIPGRIPAVVHRTYNPLDPFAISRFTLGLGPGWTFSVDVVAQEESVSLTRIVLPGNARFAFMRQADGTYANTTHARFAGAVLTKPGAGEYRLRFKDGTAWRFTTPSSPPGLAGVGILVEVTDRNANRLQIDRGNGVPIQRIIEPGGRELVFTNNGGKPTTITDPIGRTIQYTYNRQGLLETATDPAGGQTRYQYDGEKRIVSITDARGITYITNDYGANGQVARQTQADGGVWKFGYEYACALCPSTAGGRSIEPGAAAALGTIPCICGGSGPVGVSVTDPRGNVTHYRGFPLPVEVVDALGQRTGFQRDSKGQITKVTDPLGRETRFEYDALGNITRTIDAAGNEERFEYAGPFPQLVRWTDPLGNLTQFDYDAAGNVARITDPLRNRTEFEYDERGQPVIVRDALGNESRLGYDGVGNLVALTDPLGNTAHLGYDGVSRLISETDPRGRTTRFTYTPLNEVTEIDEPLAGATRLEYDANGNVVALVDAQGHRTAYEYDVMDRPVSRTDPLGRRSTTAYDANGNPVEVVDRASVRSRFTYDPLDRQARADFGDGTSVTLGYDAAGRLARLADSADGTILFAYDALDRPVSETNRRGEVAWAYDALGRQVSLKVTGQGAVRYSYDAASRLTAITAPTGTFGFSYDGLSRRTALQMPNGVRTTYEWDPASRLTRLAYDAGTTPLGDLRYAYDATGRRTQITGSLARTLLPPTVGAASYNAANQQTRFGAAALEYDANGQLVTINEPQGRTSLSWDARGQLQQLDGAWGQASFSYDALGRRVARTTGTETVSYQYDGLQAVEEVSSSGPVPILVGPAIDEVLFRHDRYFLADALRTTIALTDAAGKATTTYDYEPFGRTSLVGQSSDNPHQFTGRERDLDNLYFYRARYYSPALHRFLSEDPIEFGGGDTNLYGYVANDPTNLIDPSGQCFLVGAIIGGLSDAVTTIAINKLTGRKTFEGVGQAAVIGGGAGAVTCGVSRAISAYRAAQALRAAKKGVNVADDFFAGTRYTNKVLGQIKQGDFHAFPRSVEGFQSAGKVTKITGNDGITRDILKIPGSYRNREGVFEFIKESDGAINHRLFRPNPGQ